MMSPKYVRFNVKKIPLEKIDFIFGITYPALKKLQKAIFKIPDGIQSVFIISATMHTTNICSPWNKSEEKENEFTFANTAAKVIIFF